MEKTVTMTYAEHQDLLAQIDEGKKAFNDMQQIYQEQYFRLKDSYTPEIAIQKVKDDCQARINRVESTSLRKWEAWVKDLDLRDLKFKTLKDKINSYNSKGGLYRFLHPFTED